MECVYICFFNCVQREQKFTFYLYTSYILYVQWMAAGGILDRGVNSPSAHRPVGVVRCPGTDTESVTSLSPREEGASAPGTP